MKSDLIDIDGAVEARTDKAVLRTLDDMVAAPLRPVRRR